MCNRYTSPQELDIERAWHVGRQSPNRWWDTTVFPRGTGVFIRRARDNAGYSRELVAGQWGLIPFYAKEPRQRFPMNNARSEELLDKVSFRDVWQRGQRCIIPAASFDEPFWGPYDQPFERCEWWRFMRADGDPWGLAGIWTQWEDRKTGTVYESYSMLTINADGHELMGKMHKNELDPATKKPLPLAQQDKRSVIAIDIDDVDQWLAGTVAEASELLRVPPAALFSASPAT
ncbi:SOS response-associated peptidase [Delftia lacustris]|uniref:SOS response-associated peptidase n=1 Tax=Delftia lacustris TaxID=558537 RepID=UPI0035A6E299